MEQKNLKINQISTTRKTRKIRTVTLGADVGRKKPKSRMADEQESMQKRVLSWDGLASALSFSVPFIVVIAINLQSAAALAAILAAVLLPVTALRFSMSEKLGFPDVITVPACALVSVGITAFAAVVIRSRFPQINDSLGIYIYLFSAYPVVAAVFYGKHARRLGNAMIWALRNILYFSCAAIITGIVREFLAYNRFMGLTLSGTFKLEAAKMPFFGFIVLAFVLAAATRIHMAIKVRFPAPPTTPEPEETEAVEPPPESGVEALAAAVEPVAAAADEQAGTPPENNA